MPVLGGGKALGRTTIQRRRVAGLHRERRERRRAQLDARHLVVVVDGDAQPDGVIRREQRRTERLDGAELR